MTDQIQTEVRKIEDGEIITETGIYEMSNDWYHQQCCDGPSLSSTGIRKLLSSPAEFWKNSALNPNYVDEGDKEAFILGRAAHHLLLGEKDFDKHFVVQPAMRPDDSILPITKQRKWSGNAGDCKAWLAEQKAYGLTVLTSAQIEKIRGMAGLLPWQKGMTNCGLANTPLVAQGGALSGEIERSLIFKIDGVWIKSRPDSIPNSSNDFSDLKTTSSKTMAGVSHRSLTYAIRDSGYHVQGAVIGMGSREVLGRQMEGFHLIFVDTGGVHAVWPRTIDEADIVRGERGVFTAIKIFQRCLETGVWPGPTARQADAQRISIYERDREEIDRHLDELEQEYA